jgi:hypothetical protein
VFYLSVESSSDFIISDLRMLLNKELESMRKGRGRMWSQFGLYPGVFLDGLRKDMKNFKEKSQ